MKINIKPLPQTRLAEFFLYLSDHISDNGHGNSPLFLPISRNELKLTEKLKKSFEGGLSVPIENMNWRRAFIAVNHLDEIIGHVDLKSLNELYTNHRAVMGLGVHRDYRKLGIGGMLIDAIIDWAMSKTMLEYIDLWVLSANKAAIRLYEKHDFQSIGVMEDMFRIDGAKHDYTLMTKSLSK